MYGYTVINTFGPTYGIPFSKRFYSLFYFWGLYRLHNMLRRETLLNLY